MQPTTHKVSLHRTMQTLNRYKVLCFVVFLLVIYGFLGWRVYTLEQAEPDQEQISSKLHTAGVPKIDQDVINKIQKLQDNSVSVQSLFDQARSSPFQE